MARPLKTGLEYFPMDVDMDRDEKVAYVISVFGFNAFGIIVKLYMEIYRLGYYLIWDERQMYLLSRQISPIKAEELDAVVQACIEEGIFDSNCYESYGVLTSHGIQYRYLQAASRRIKVEFSREIFLLDETEIRGAKIEFVKLKLSPSVYVSKFINSNLKKNNCSQDDDKNGVSVSKNVVSVNKNGVSVINGNINGVSDDRNGVSVDSTLAESTQSKVKESKVNTTTGSARTRTRARIIEENHEESDWREVVEAYSNNVHPISGEIELGKLQDLYEQYGAAWMIAGITEAVVSSKGPTSLKYLEAILQRWKRDGFKAPKKVGKGIDKRGNSKLGTREIPDEDCDDFAEADRNQRNPWDIQPSTGIAGA